jgi:site-specific DNA-methyltransferase (adenine-specific)
MQWLPRKNPGGYCQAAKRTLRVGEDGLPVPDLLCDLLHVAHFPLGASVLGTPPESPKPKAARAKKTHNIEVMTSSEMMDWGTPQAFVDALPFVFDVDVCAVESNAKCPSWITPETDALAVPWRRGDHPTTAWMNPPYGRNIGRWLEKAYAESLLGVDVVALVPNRTETAWFDLVWRRAVLICFLGTRIRFEHPDPEKEKNGAPFANVIALFSEGCERVILEDKADVLAALGTVILPGVGNIWPHIAKEGDL